MSKILRLLSRMSFAACLSSGMLVVIVKFCSFPCIVTRILPNSAGDFSNPLTDSITNPCHCKNVLNMSRSASWTAQGMVIVREGVSLSALKV